MGALLQENPGLVSLPFQPPAPEELPVIKDWVYFTVAVNSLILAIVTGKTAGWRLGDSFKEALKVSLLLLAALALGTLIL